MKQPKASTALRTPEDVKAEFKRQGQSISGWAMKNRFPPHLVYAILGGNKDSKCVRGDSHRIAVLLRLKHGELIEADGQAA
jgi:gp16 family phage-associated protein